MLRSVSTVSYCVDRFDESCRVPAEIFDYQCVERGRIDGPLAQFWYAPATAGRRFAVYAPASEARVFLRLIEADTTPGYVPLRTFGWNATEFLVRDVYALAESLTGGPLEVIGGPRDLLKNGVAIALQTRGPSGEVYYLTQINGEAMQRTYGKAECDVDRVFIVVLGAHDFEMTREYFRALGLHTPRSREFSIRVLANAHGLDPLTTKFPIGSAVMPDPFRIEIDGYPESASVRPCSSRHLPPGMCMVSFETSSWPEAGQATLGSHASIPYNGRGARLLSGPNGELLELLAPSI